MSEILKYFNYYLMSPSETILKIPDTILSKTTSRWKQSKIDSLFIHTKIDINPNVNPVKKLKLKRKHEKILKSQIENHLAEKIDVLTNECSKTFEKIEKQMKHELDDNNIESEIISNDYKFDKSAKLITDNITSKKNEIPMKVAIQVH